MAPTNNNNYQWIKNENFQKDHKRVLLALFFFFFFFETKWQNWAKLQSFSLSFYEPKVWNRLGDTLLQHMSQWQITGCVQVKQQVVWHVATTNLYMYWGIFVKIFISATEFSHWTNRFWFEFVWLIAGTKFSCGDMGFHKILPYTQRNLSYDCNLLPLCVGATCHLVCSALKDYHW